MPIFSCKPVIKNDDIEILTGNTNLSSYNRNKKKFHEKEAKDEPLIKNRDIIKLIIIYAVPFIMIDVVKTLYDFIHTSRDEILDFAKSNDITIMLKVCPFCTQMDGFFGFNFFDVFFYFIFYFIFDIISFIIIIR